jgi:hypothetical protein
MPRLLKEETPVVLMELHGSKAARVAWETLTAAGYQITSLEAESTPVHSVEALDWKAYIMARPGL